MYKTILVPLDGSRRAEAILPHVEELVHRYEARVILLRVVEPVAGIPAPHGGPHGSTHYDIWAADTRQQLDEAEQYLKQIAGEFREKGIPVETRVEHNPAIVMVILNVAAAAGADLVAMASHGRSGLGRVFYGSVAAGVLQGIDRPLLLVRA